MSAVVSECLLKKEVSLDVVVVARATTSWSRWLRKRAKKELGWLVLSFETEW